MKKLAYTTILPLAFAASAHGQNYDSKTLESFFTGKESSIASAYGTIVQDRSRIENNTYFLNKLCPNDTYDAGPFKLRYSIFKKQFKRPYFELESVFNYEKPVYSGVFPIITATNTVHTDINELNKYHTESKNKDHTIQRKYDLLLNKLHEDSCVDMTVLFEEKRISTFGDLLPRPKK